MTTAPSSQTPPVEGTFFDRIGIPSVLKWGFLGVLLFMTGLGIESNFIAPHLEGRMGSPGESVALVITLYSLAVLVASYLSGALADLWGPKKVMLLGFVIWMVFQVGFLLSIETDSLFLVGLMYFMRGFGFPLFAFAFLVWINITAQPSKAGTAIGWFYVMFTGGLPTLGSLVAIGSIPALGGGAVGETWSMWGSIALIVLGFCCAWFGCHEERGKSRIAPAGESASSVVLAGLRLTASNPKVLQGFLVRLINTAPQFGMFIIMPAVISTTLGWGQSRWLLMTVCVYAGNILFNAFFGAVGDRIGWVNTVRWCGVFASALGLLAWWYVPHLVPAGSTWGYVVSVIAGVTFGIFLAGFVPMGAIMPENAPKHRGAAMAMYTTAAGGATFLGSGTVWVVLTVTGLLGIEDPFIRNSAVIWTFVALYAAAFVMVGHLRTRQDDPAYRREIREADTQALEVQRAEAEQARVTIKD
ncbi:RbtT/DalT/CsbX family MFS transporter [Rothia sp. AR01]|uniref:RbtT/DalT/CsbX family MFS transporter n=1 Tax=Rothia santali TaxID=2949643 RepID=A0A9X2HC54_9MICC|nr:RbtT/DalT/CsbX family MFS transporter [Rothia santali]MCP3425420.1 RbtT/DalT/CsbX family MFS transporter [Rothia santali]